jgi:hypothetical protein
VLTVLGPSRPLPRVGARARVVHFGGGAEAATVLAVHDEGRRLIVRCAAAGLREFVLSPATARFVLADEAHGPRLELLGGRA